MEVEESDLEGDSGEVDPLPKVGEVVLSEGPEDDEFFDGMEDDPHQDHSRVLPDHHHYQVKAEVAEVTVAEIVKFLPFVVNDVLD